MLAGFIGSLVGLGGGVLITPLLVMLLGVPIKTSISASLVAVTVTSSVSTVYCFEKKLINSEAASYTLLSVIVGSYTGAHIAITLPSRVLKVAFGVLLLVVSILMFKRPSKAEFKSELRFTSRFWMGCILAFAAGLSSGLFGVGGGFLLVPIMNLVMRMPLKEAIATSLVVVGGAGSTGAVVYFESGFLNPIITSLVVIGVFFGALAGSKAMVKLKAWILRLAFVCILLYLAFKMIMGA